jgi:type IV pilus assembly protein PilA
MMKRVQQGFTLIELMIVVAIVGILAAIALPAYQDYIARSKMTEVMAALGAAKTSVSEYAGTNNRLPTTVDEAGISAPAAAAKYISGLTWANNRVEATVKTDGVVAALNGKVVFMTPTMDAGTNQVTWTCGTDADATAYKYLPSNCRSAS